MLDPIPIEAGGLCILGRAYGALLHPSVLGLFRDEDSSELS